MPAFILAEDVPYTYQVTAREFFAYLPRLTITGFAWLVDVREVLTLEQCGWKNRTVRRHFERLYAR